MEIIERKEDMKRWEKIGKRVLVYGRRKVGKSFFVRNFTKWDEYFFVKRDGGILDTKNWKEISYEYLKDLLLREKKRIVIDEFQRLPEEFLDFLHANAENLELTLITSTLWLSLKILGKGSPLLGIFEEFKMGLVDERDALRFTFQKERGKEIVEKAVYLREPWLVELMKGETRKEIARILKEEKNTIERLIGEIFREEERFLKEIYIAILTAIACGKNKSTEISSFLFSRKLIPKDDASTIQSYLKILQQIGLIKRIEAINKKFYFYSLSSPLLDLYFYLEGKYGFSETEIPLEEIERVVNEKISFHVEDFFRELFSKIFGLKVGKIIEKDYDVDVVLYSFKRIEAVGEVKWRDFVSRKEVEEIEERLRKFEKKFLIVPEKKNLEKIPEGIEVIDVEKLKELVKE